ncbi:DegT/DnrJ/EryC1/StrS family aminotransferase [Natrononativus amylolyticus]|uniref:DegT/DnrJ/EryC1/StrS family aminotransferase n=1 Tax=Natrononativus amylolyticus TaxID=2963434 RepID=UPI0020CE642B|nr:DegT/DnrJ/EryC1/StrS family aminotransferase [Natrononativus amylolyticus]
MTDLAINGGPEAAADLEIPRWPQCTETSKEYVLDSLESEKWCRIIDGADWVDRFEEEFAEFHDAEHAIAVSNGTVAIELALRACGVKPGDEVLVPAYTFIASASAIACMGAVPKFVDVDPDTFNLDPESVREEITADTVGIVGVHFGGYPMDMDELLPIVEEHELFLIEDAAHAQGSAWRGERVGTFGDFGTFSFQQSKALPAGEGGIVVTDDDVLAEEARLVHNIGRAVGAGYKHTMLASNYRLPELQGALLCAQLEKLPEENERRQRNEELLVSELETIDGIHTLRADDRITDRGYCVYNFRYDAEAFGGLSRDRFLEALTAEGVPASSGYGLPLYKQPAFSREQLGALVPPGTDIPVNRHRHLPGVEKIMRTNVRLSHTALLAEDDTVLAIPRAIRKIQENVDELLLE